MTHHFRAVVRSLTRAASETLRAVLGILGIAAGLLLSLYALAVCTTRGQLLENTSVLGSDAAHADPTWLQHLLASIADDRALPLIVAGILILGWQQGRLRTAAVAAATVLAADVATQVLKNLVFVRPDLVLDLGVGAGNSLPSGTVTFLLSSALGLAMVLPRTPLARALACLLVGSAIAGGCATIMLGWHRPADVIAGVIVVVASFTAARSFLDRTVGSHVSDFDPSAEGLLICGAISLLPLLAALVAPASPVDSTAPCPHVYVISMVVVTVASAIATAPLATLLCSDDEWSTPSGRPAESEDGAGVTRDRLTVVALRRPRQQGHRKAPGHVVVPGAFAKGLSSPEPSPSPTACRARSTGSNRSGRSHRARRRSSSR